MDDSAAQAAIPDVNGNDMNGLKPRVEKVQDRPNTGDSWGTYGGGHGGLGGGR